MSDLDRAIPKPQFSQVELRYLVAVEIQMRFGPLIGDPMPLERAYEILAELEAAVISYPTSAPIVEGETNAPTQ